MDINSRYINRKRNGDVKIFASKVNRIGFRNGYRELGDYGGMGLGANVSQVTFILF